MFIINKLNMYQNSLSIKKFEFQFCICIFFILFLIAYNYTICIIDWNNNDNSRFVPPRNLLAYSTVCVCSSTSCELVYFQFLPPPPPPSSSRLFHVYTYAATCFVCTLQLYFLSCEHVRAFMHADRPRVKYFPSCNETLTFNKFVSCV